jgi:hypothetical protein
MRKLGFIIVLGLSGCAHHPGRIDCEAALQPINIELPTPVTGDMPLPVSRPHLTSAEAKP